jgi:hypothetical protein
MINDKMNDNDKNLLFDRSSIGKSLLCVNIISLPLAAYRPQHLAAAPMFRDVHKIQSFLPYRFSCIISMTGHALKTQQRKKGAACRPLWLFYKAPRFFF